jgi:hypothetical protein
MKRLILICGVVIYFAALPFAAPFLFGAILGFSGEILQRLVLLSIVILPWLPVAAWIIFHCYRRRN